MTSPAPFRRARRCHTAKSPSDWAIAHLARDVGQALGQNPFPVIVPCHRVLAAGGKVGGFSAPGGVVTKLRLLTIEGAQPNGPTLFDRLPLQAPRRRA